MTVDGGRAGGPAPGRRAAGFTLLEILVTVAIIGIVSALAAPAIAGRLLETPAARSARLLKGMLEEARARAATRGEVVAVLWSPETRRFALRDGSRERALEIPSGVLVTAQGLIRAGSGEEHEDPRSAVVFFPLGGSSGGSIALRAGTSRFVLDLDRVTGSVKAEGSR